MRAVASVSAPIDLAEASRRFHEPRNRFYHWHMMRNLRREALAPGAVLGDDERAAVQSARTLFEFDDRFVAPRNGFADAADYYARCSSGPLLDAVDVPALAIHADDDPWIPATPYRERAAKPANGVQVLLAPGGGHVGFHARAQQDAAPCWHDRCIEIFFRRAFA